MVGKGGKGGITTSSFSVEGVSWMEQLFQMMASRDPNGKLLSVNVPDTVVFRYQRPAALYYTEEGQMRSTDDMSELSADALMNRYSRKGTLAAEELCAMYVYRERKNEGDEKGTKDFTVEYMNSSQLHVFLNLRVKDNNGMLQRFTPSRGQSNTTIRVMWTPRKCIIESCANKHSMHDTRVPMTQKVPTFDGGPHLTTVHDVSKGLFSTKVTESFMSVLQHVESLLPKGYHVWETTMYWKFAGGDRHRGLTEEAGTGLTFLWCSTMRLFRDEIIDLRRLDGFWAHDVEADRVTSKPAPQRKNQMAYCPVSGELLAPGAGVLIKASTLITYMRNLARKRPPPPEAVKLMHEAVVLEEQSKHEDLRSTKAHEGSHHDMVAVDAAKLQQEIEEEVTALLRVDKDVKRPKALVDRAVVEIAIRGLFSQGATNKQRMILSHKRVLDYEIEVSEDVGLVASQVAMAESEKSAVKLHTAGDGAGGKRGTKPNVRGELQSSMRLDGLRGGRGSSGVTGCRVVEVKDITVKEQDKDGLPPTDRKKKAPERGSKPSALTAVGSSQAGLTQALRESTAQLESVSVGSRIMLLRRMHFAASASPEPTANSPQAKEDMMDSGNVGQAKARAASAHERGEDRRAGGARAMVLGEYQGLHRGKGTWLEEARKPIKTREGQEAAVSGGNRNIDMGGQRALSAREASVGAQQGGGSHATRERPQTTAHARSREEGRGNVAGEVARTSSAGRRRGGMGAPAIEEISKDFIIEDDDEDEWDDGLEMDLPSTQKKLLDTKAKPAPPQGQRSASEDDKGWHQLPEPVRRGASDASRHLCSHPPSRNLPLYLQWGHQDKVRERVLGQYKAFSVDVGGTWGSTEMSR